jgi:hypothetical protein
VGEIPFFRDIFLIFDLMATIESKKLSSISIYTFIN